MKIKGELYVTLHNAIKLIVEHHGAERIKEMYKDLSTTRMMFDMFHKATGDLSYDDTHPRYERTPRIVPHKPGFSVHDVYKNGVNDDHIATALKKICKELGLL